MHVPPPVRAGLLYCRIKRYRRLQRGVRRCWSWRLRGPAGACPYLLLEVVVQRAQAWVVLEDLRNIIRVPGINAFGKLGDTLEVLLVLNCLCFSRRDDLIEELAHFLVITGRVQ